ncbi:class I SAM-dependent methyltransferase [Micromonospora olivasterospora]|uniref:Methyltransferase family protein n=1 Tax=Micromonospora olivasterospora TaxID=1880 RepID=A0A562IHD4_MICOL|nr:class I SAM-dependent methyltransferase [Micromonospora olivasterospora]TWH70135.1 methyltransferase family protein [Micromonospora olivasterospora]
MPEEPTYDAIADWYEYDFLSRWTGKDVLGINRTTRDLLGPGVGACLEVGCGTGVRAGHVREACWTPIGVDISAGMLAHARARLPVVRADAGRLPLAGGSVPAAVGVMVHTDLPDLPAAVREVARVLRPGGVFAHVGAHPCFVGDFTDPRHLRDTRAQAVRTGVARPRGTENVRTLTWSTPKFSAASGRVLRGSPRPASRS